MKFSANLGFLWAELPLPAAIRAAHKAGFDAVECHWPYDTPPAEVRDALAETGLPMLGLNTRRGPEGTFGLSALPGRAAEARAAVDEALDYAAAVGAQAVHVLAGRAEGPAAQEAFLRTLSYARAQAPAEMMLLIEPLNPYDAPGYFLNTTEQAIALLQTLDAQSVKLMFDAYHVARTEGDPIPRLNACLPFIGHIQFAGVPDRGPPHLGTGDHARFFAEVARLGWRRPLGAEYKPGGATEDSLAWRAAASGAV